MAGVPDPQPASAVGAALWVWILAVSPAASRGKLLSFSLPWLSHLKNGTVVVPTSGFLCGLNEMEEIAPIVGAQ